MSTTCRSQYLHSILDNGRLVRVVRTLVKVIKRKVGVENFDAIAYRGMSGAGVATVVGYLLKKPLVMVRKVDIESAHSCYNVEGAIDAKRMVVIDDCIATGSTLYKIVKDIIHARQVETEGLEVVAVLLYNDGSPNYCLLTGDENPVEKFKPIFSFSICSNPKNGDVFKAMSNTKFYSFYTKKGTRSYKTTLGSNLDVDDVK